MCVGVLVRFLRTKQWNTITVRRVCVCVYIYVCLCVYVCIYIFVYVCVYVCMYVCVLVSKYGFVSLVAEKPKSSLHLPDRSY